MRISKIHLRLMFLFTCMLPRRGADALGYMSFIFFCPVFGLSIFSEFCLIGHVNSIRNLAIIGIPYWLLFFLNLFLKPYYDEQRHINRLVFKCKYRFFYSILALIITALCFISLIFLMIISR